MMGSHFKVSVFKQVQNFTARTSYLSTCLICHHWRNQKILRMLSVHELKLNWVLRQSSKTQNQFHIWMAKKKIGWLEPSRDAAAGSETSNSYSKTYPFFWIKAVLQGEVKDWCHNIARVLLHLLLLKVVQKLFSLRGQLFFHMDYFSK